MAAQSDVTYSFGRHLPAEVVGNIFRQVWLIETDITMAPHASASDSDPTQGSSHVKESGGISVSGMGGLYHTCSASWTMYRDTFRRLFKKQALSIDLSGTIEVENFDFGCLGMLFGLMSENYHTKPITVHLTFTSNFLAKPTDESIEHWLRVIGDDQRKARLFNFEYTVKPIPEKYVIPTLDFTNHLVYIRNGKTGPELLKIMQGIGGRYRDGSITAKGDEELAYGDLPEPEGYRDDIDLGPAGEDNSDAEDGGEHDLIEGRYNLRRREQR